MSWDELVSAAKEIRDAAVIADRSLGALPLAGIGWATVEAERAVVELEALFIASGAGGGSPTPTSWAPGERDPALGARAWLRATATWHGGPWLVVLEPDTEGRIAASLARFGEGVAVAYLGEGLLRPGRLVRGGPTWGPHVVVLGAAGDPPDDVGPPWGAP